MGTGGRAGCVLAPGTHRLPRPASRGAAAQTRGSDAHASDARLRRIDDSEASLQPDFQIPVKNRDFHARAGDRAAIGAASEPIPSLTLPTHPHSSSSAPNRPHAATSSPWGPDSWKSRLHSQQVVYPDRAAVEAISIKSNDSQDLVEYIFID